MAGRGWATRPWAAAVLAALLALPAACAAPAPVPAPREELGQLLARQSAAVTAGDRDAYLAEIDPAATGYAALRRQAFDNLRALPLEQWSYRLLSVHPLPEDGDRAVVRAELSHRLRGHDRTPVTDEEQWDAVRRGDRWYLSGERDGSARQLWEQGALTVQRGSRSLVLGVGRDRASLRELAAEADRAVPAVDAAWKRPWTRRVVVLAPAGVNEMAELLGAPPADYRGIAAVTTSAGDPGAHAERGDGTARHRASADPGPTSGPAPAVRVLVNPGAYGALSAEGRRVVMTHEVTHAATRGATTAATPLWLSEGFADWAGYLGTDRTPEQAAPELAREVRAGRVPRQLPSDEDFTFGRSAAELALAYEGGWLACLLIARDWGPKAPGDLYRAMGGQSADAALREVLGVGEAEFTARWRDHLRAELGGSPARRPQG
ncbi:hypothetical protein QNO07_19335 [Streptomyces sp. 549]|uniref:hypothetical protein n=1 Tax=Streptomyces sp. 549 TaxID=3049076 RepID=UPI0024C26B2F|nr:hypothetical protein [Streptomyces sp. 549]MDK1475544.1 hypothetical protein [Streptomyces sp. 549]